MTGTSRLLAFGCSFTKGVIRIPEKYVGRTGNPEHAEPYPEIIAKNLNLNYKNMAATASGNKQIAWKIRNTSIFDYDVVIVAWSGPLRPYIWLPEDARYDTLEARELGEDFFDPSELIYETETCIRATNDYLKSTGCKFLMISALMDYKQYYGLEEITDWYRFNWIEPGMYNNSIMDICTGDWLTPKCNKIYDQDRMEENRALVDQTEINPFLSGCKHPSQEGHDKIADVLQPYVETLIYSA